jgi:hypothetical protein
MGLTELRPALRAAMQGWLSFMEGVTLDWLDSSDFSRQHACELVLGAFHGAVAAAQGIDPMIPDGAARR